MRACIPYACGSTRRSRVLDRGHGGFQLDLGWIEWRSTWRRDAECRQRLDTGWTVLLWSRWGPEHRGYHQVSALCTRPRRRAVTLAYCAGSAAAVRTYSHSRVTQLYCGRCSTDVLLTAIASHGSPGRETALDSIRVAYVPFACPADALQGPLRKCGMILTYSPHPIVAVHIINELPTASGCQRMKMRPFQSPRPRCVTARVALLLSAVRNREAGHLIDPCGGSAHAGIDESPATHDIAPFAASDTLQGIF
ncbi:hypothetical protein DAEQUDRAFT_525960 [Daedalea quercina L-15889]|uniref:Uncharacterized protein n=1 Tax=Daedalea quercina L-15889 TaxID=1314783 RepID=A0A165MC87_9APHY|nr:hypothetical protein DAEQUDRAFT_525960 [Daedalea quercina L-15889]